MCAATTTPPSYTVRTCLRLRSLYQRPGVTPSPPVLLCITVLTEKLPISGENSTLEAFAPGISDVQAKAGEPVRDMFTVLVHLGASSLPTGCAPDLDLAILPNDHGALLQ